MIAFAPGPSGPVILQPAEERERLVRLCARWVGDRDAAEDLAQETLLVAYQHADRLRDPDRRSQWLAGIARRRCLDWLRRRYQEGARVAPARPRHGQAFSGDESEGGGTLDPLARVADGVDLEVELERAELAALLDRAMALLPDATRQVLIERHVHQSPQAELALRLGLSEGAVAMRLHRGKLALRRLLSTDLRDEAAAFGLIEASDAGWRETTIWCTNCGVAKLVGRFVGPERVLWLRCPRCREHYPDAEYVRQPLGTR